MANEQNLTPFTSDQNREEAVKNGKKGGVASGKAKRRKKSMREAAELILSLKAPEAVLAKMRADGVPKSSNTYLDATVFAAIGQAVEGNTKAFDMLMELLGEKVKKVELAGVDDKSLAEMEEFLNGQSADL